MAIERKVDTAQKVVAAAPPKGASGKKAPATRSGVAKPAAGAFSGSAKIAQLRIDLSAARRELALQKLDSPAKIRKLRKDLARALTAERSAATLSRPTPAAQAKEAA